MLLLVQGGIFFKHPILLLPSITALGELLICTIRHVIDVSGSQVMILNENESQSPILVLLSRFEVCSCVHLMEDCNHLVQNQCSVGNERVGERTYFFRVSSKHHRTT